MWLLLTGNPKDPVGTWVDENVALTPLKEESWIINGPYPKQISKKQVPRESVYGYAMMRTID
jgi:hypothetical protein